MPNDLVRWNDLLNFFISSNPQTVDYVLDTKDTAKVMYQGNVFEIRPRPGHPFAVDIYGPAALAEPSQPVIIL